MSSNPKEFLTFFITMVIGGLVYSIVSFAYMHKTFTTNEVVNTQGGRINRIDTRLDKRLNNIESKIDRLIERIK